MAVPKNICRTSDVGHLIAVVLFFVLKPSESLLSGILLRFLDLKINMFAIG